MNNFWLVAHLCLLALLVLEGDRANASVITSPEGYQTYYGISMNPGTSNGSDIEGVFVFEWDNSDNYSAFYGGLIAGSGNTYLSHEIEFLPTSALIIGYGAGIPGVLDELDHLYTITSLAFSYTVGGLKWSEAFPGVPPEPRIGHNAMVDLLKDAASGSSSALTDIYNWVKTEGYRAAFDPRGNFAVLEWTGCDAGEEPVQTPNGYICVPVGGSIPEPGTWILLVIGLLGLMVTQTVKRKPIHAYW